MNDQIRKLKDELDQKYDRIKDKPNDQKQQNESI